MGVFKFYNLLKPISSQRRRLIKHWAVPLALFLLALLVRAPELDRFTTFDESRWLRRSRWFTIGLLFPEQECPPVDWGREFSTQGVACTLQIGYPGATTMWAGSLGLLLYYWQTAGPTVDLLTFLQSLSFFDLDPGIIAPSRLPLAVAGALFVPYFYGLARRLFGGGVALVAALLVALQPFHIALSRVLHHDALNSTFMVLAVLALAGYWLRGWPWYWLPVSGLLAGLAFLSKQVSWFLLPYVGVLAGWTLLYRWHQSRLAADGSREPFSLWGTVGRLAGQGAAWGLVAGLTFGAFFPAMWAIPVEVLQTIFRTSSALAGEGHTHYFLGEVSKDPGPLFYPVGWLLRATPFEVGGLLALAAAALWQGVRGRAVALWQHPVKVALALFVGLLWLFLSVSDKKMVRYALPAFPVIDLFAAFGWLWLLGRLHYLGPPLSGYRKKSGSPGFAGIGLLAGLLLVGQGWLAVGHYPYYLTYYNPMFGGAPGAARLMTIMGWGEGLPEAADYLNQQPGAESLQVVAERFCSMLRPFFVGQVTCLNSSAGGILAADYLVYYYNVIQRKLPWPEQWRYFQQHRLPAHRITLHGLDYVLIYRNPIDHQIDREANRWSGRFTVFGYGLPAGGELRLFWQNEGLGPEPLWVGVAPSDGVYPVNGPAVSLAERQWVACPLDPAFAAEANRPGTILESRCPLASVDLSPGLYDLQFGLARGNSVTPLESSRLAVVVVDRLGQVKPVPLVGGSRN